jgi:hypothetical protein
MRARRILIVMALLLPACFGPDDVAKVVKRVAGGSGASLPTGFTRVETGASGEAIYARIGGGSATQRLGEGFSQLEDYLAGLQPVGAYREHGDARAQALFRADRDGRPVVGVAIATTGPNGELLAVAFDEAARAEQTIPTLLQALGGVTAGQATSARPEVQWTTASIPDGSGQVRIPVGWRVIGGSRGAVDVQGPGGEIMSLGLGMPVMLPEATISPLTGQPMPGVINAPWTDPPTALAQLLPQVAEVTRAMNPSAPWMEFHRVVEAAPVNSAVGGQAAFVLWDLAYGGQPYRSLAYIDMGRPVGGQWMFYTSMVSAPVGRFEEALPVMMESWQRGWNIDPQVFQDRLQGALQTMRETHEIWRQGNAGTQRVMDDAQADWTEAFRGTRVVRDLATGEEGSVDLGWVDQTVDRLNEREGWNRYEPIPLRDWYRGR